MRSETLHLDDRTAQELERFQRQPMNFASIEPNDRQLMESALRETRCWLDAVEVYTDSNLPLREADGERVVLAEYAERLAYDSPRYAAFIGGIVRSLPDMNPDCRLAVNMPASDEGATIGRALGHMLVRESSGKTELAQLDSAGNTLDPAQYEVLVCANRPNDRQKDGTAEAIESFINERQLPVNIMAIDVTLPAAVANNGMARRVLHDVSVMRSVQRREQTGVLYIAAEDADIDGYDPHAFDTYITYLDNHQDKSAARMRTERNPIDMMTIPHLLIKHRFMTQLITILRSSTFQPDVNPNYNFKFNRKVPSGYGTAFVASELVAAGGFPITESSTDLLLGEQIAVMRGNVDRGRVEPASATVGAVPSVVLSSARREIVSYLHDQDPYNKGSFSDTTTHDRTRQPIDKLIQLAEEKDIFVSREWLMSQMTKGMQRIAATAPSPEVAERSERLLLAMVGFEKDDYDLRQTASDVHFTVSSWQHIEQKANSYLPSRRIRDAAANTR